MRIQPIQIKRFTKTESRFHPKMGALTTNVTRIQKTFLGLPIKTLHEYRETYTGKIKDCEECKLSVVE